MLSKRLWSSVVLFTFIFSLSFALFLECQAVMQEGDLAVNSGYSGRVSVEKNSHGLGEMCSEAEPLLATHPFLQLYGLPKTLFPQRIQDRQSNVYMNLDLYSLIYPLSLRSSEYHFIARFQFHKKIRSVVLLT